MFKRKTINLTIAFHVSILLLIVAFAFYRSGVNQKCYVDTIANELHGITKTVSVIGSNNSTKSLLRRYQQDVEVDILDPDYLRISTDFQHILLTHGLDNCELSLVIIGDKDRGAVRLVSSDRLYSFGDPLFDRSNLIVAHMSQGASSLIDVNEDIQKIMAFDPVMDKKGNVLGIVRIETGDRSAHLKAAADVYWMSTPFLIYLFIALIHVFMISRSISNQKASTLDSTVLEDLEKKNQELKMLSLVAKKSDNLMLITDERGQILWVNETYEEKNNFSAEELNQFIGKHLSQVSQNPNIRTIVKNVVDFNEPITYESSAKDAKGNRHFAMTTVTPISEDNGRVINLLFVDTDITKIKLAEEQQAMFRDIVEKCELPRIVSNGKGDIIYANAGATPLLETWTDTESILEPKILAMLSSIYDIGIEQVLTVNISDITMELTVQPDTKNDSIMIIANRILDENSTNGGITRSNREFKEAV